MNQTEQTSSQATPGPEVVPSEQVGAGFDFSDPKSPLAPLYLRTSGVLAGGLLALVFLLANCVPLWHSDVWGHLKFGEWIWKHGHLPEHEPFVPWNDHPVPFIQFYTLSQLAFYWLYQLGAHLTGGDDLRQLAGGIEMLRLGFSLLVLARFAVLLLAYRRVSGSLPQACAALVLLLVLSFSSMLVMRPQVFGELFFALLLLALGRPLLSWRFLAVLPVFFALWANTHGSFLVGLGLLAVCCSGRILEATRQAGWGGVRNDPQIRRLLLALLIGAGASCLNPHGPALYRHALGLASNPVILRLAEWQPLGLFPWPFLVGVPFVGSLLILALTQWLSPRPFTPAHLQIVIVFGLGACLQERFLNWWIVLTPWIAVQYWKPSERPVGKEAGPSPGASFRKTLLAGGLVFAVLMWSPSMGWLLEGNPRPVGQLVVPATPWELARQLHRPEDSQAQWSSTLANILKANYPEGRFTGSIFVSETLGDFLLWELAPEVPLSSYSHLHLFPRSYWDEVLPIYQGQPGWWDLLRRRRANLVVIEAEIYPRLRDRLRANPGWEVVLDETGNPRKVPAQCRLFIAVRKKPV